MSFIILSKVLFSSLLVSVVSYYSFSCELWDKVISFTFQHSAPHSTKDHTRKSFAIIIIICVYVCVCVCVVTFVWVCVCMCAHMNMCTSVYLCICMWRIGVAGHCFLQSLSVNFLRLSFRFSHWTLNPLITGLSHTVGLHVGAVDPNSQPFAWAKGYKFSPAPIFLWKYFCIKKKIW